jgi:hypothetical protein
LVSATPDLQLAHGIEDVAGPLAQPGIARASTTTLNAFSIQDMAFSLPLPVLHRNVRRPTVGCRGTIESDMGLGRPRILGNRSGV